MSATTIAESPSLTLNKVTDHVLSTTGHDAGATLIAHPTTQGPRWTLVDHGGTPETVAERLHQCLLQGRPVSSVALMHTNPGDTWDEWIPEHVTTLTPDQASTGGTPLPHVPRARTYRISPGRAIVALPEKVVLAGDLMAPYLPDLSRTSPRRAREGLMYAAAQAPMILIGSYGHILSAHAQVATDGPVPTEHLATVAELRMREAYLEVIIAIAQHAVRSGLSPREAAYQAWGTLCWWTPRDNARVYNCCHLVNLHAAIAAEQGCQPDLAAAEADVAAL